WSNAGASTFPTSARTCSTSGVATAAIIAPSPSANTTECADETRAAPALSLARESSSVERATESATPVAAIRMSARGTRGPRSSEAGRTAAIARVAGVRASGAAPPAVCATASRHANAMASMTARVTRRVAIARELDRRTPLQGCERVARDAVHEEVRTDHGRDLIGTDDEDAMVRAAERDRGTSEAVADARRHDHERRAPREPPAFAQEHRLGGADRIGPEPREDLEAASQRARAPAEGGARPLVREVID